MPDKWDQFAVTPNAAATDKWEKFSAPASISPTSVDRPDAVDRFANGFANAVNPVPGIEAIANDPQGIKHGIEQNVFEPQRQQLVKAGEAAQGKGEFSTMNPLERASETIGHGLAGVIPGAGPAAANSADQIMGGDVAGGLGSAAGVHFSRGPADET